MQNPAYTGGTPEASISTLNTGEISLSLTIMRIDQCSEFRNMLELR